MDALKMLKEVANSDEMIARKRNEIERLRTLAEGVSGGQQGERVGTSNTGGKMEDAIIKYMEREYELQKEIWRLEALRKKMLEAIERLENHDLYDVLYMRYFENMTYLEISEKKRRTYSWATKAHGEAIRQLNRILNS